MKILRKLLPIVILLCASSLILSQSSSMLRPANTLCDFLSDPGRYTEKVITLQATYVVGFENAWIKDEDTCATAKIDRKEIDLIFEGSAGSNRRMIKKMGKLSKGYPSEMSVLFVGVFSPYEKKNELDRRYKYQFSVQEILSVEKKKKVRN